MSTAPNLQTIVVVGASLAGLRAAEELRDLGFDGHLVMVGDEQHLPYDRPPLSKELLAGEMEPDAIALRNEPYDDLRLDWQLGRRAVALDVGNRTVTLDDGSSLDFDGLVIATGARPRVLPDISGGRGGDHAGGLAGVHTLRTLDDSLAIRDALDNDARVVVVGAGFIGAEVAATCRSRGLAVTVVEALPAPMVRGLGPVLGGVLAQMHRDHGVDLRLGTGVAGFEGKGRVEQVRLTDGSVVDADLVVVGIGVTPNTEWLAGSGLTIDDGVVCDATCLAAPGVVVAGDVARWPNAQFDGELMRLEHWTNATEQGMAAASRLLATDDEAVSFAPVPFVWSHQYDVLIQVVGHVRGDDEIEIVNGSTDDYRFMAAVGRAGRLVGGVALRRPRQLMQLRKLLTEHAPFVDAVAALRDLES